MSVHSQAEQTPVSYGATRERVNGHWAWVGWVENPNDYCRHVHGTYHNALNCARLRSLAC